MDEFSLRKVDLNLLHVFEAIYMTGNITRAGEQLNMAQPTVSNALTRLRKQFDDPLFRRAEKGVIPTPTAEALIGPVRKALSILRSSFDINPVFDAASSSRIFNLAIPGFANGFIVPYLLNNIAEQAPGVKVRLFDTDNINSEDALISGELDLVMNAYLRFRDELVLVPLHKVPTALVVRKGHPDIQDTVSMDQFANARHVTLRQNLEIRQQIDSFLRQLGITRNIVCEVSASLQLPQIVAQTDLVALMPKLFAEGVASRLHLNVHDPPFELPKAQVMMATSKEAEQDSGIQWMKVQMLDVVSKWARERELTDAR